MKISDQLINISAKIMLATEKRELLNLSSEITEIAKRSLDEPTFESTAAGFLEFTKTEISKMSKTFKKEFIANGAVAHIRKRRSGRKTYCYEIRYRRNGYNITATSTNQEIAKQKFIEATNIAFKIEQQIKQPAEPTQVDILFDQIAEEWFTCKKTKVDPKTHKAYYSYYNRYILPFLKGRNIKDIRSVEFMPIMEQVKGKGRAYEDVRSVLNQIFEYTINNGIIIYNPVKQVEFIKANRKSGQALNVLEEHTMLTRLAEPQYKDYGTAFKIMLFFGLRPCELSTIQLDGDFIICRNAKRKNKSIEFKRIPISPMARKYLTLEDLKPVTHKVKRLNDVFQKIFPDKTQYHLRHTFSTRCQQFVRREIVEIWLGDSPERLIGKTYTHFPDKFMIEEMNKINYII